MKKSILNIGKALNKAEQKEINGGRRLASGPCSCTQTSDCAPTPGICGEVCFNGQCVSF